MKTEFEIVRSLGIKMGWRDHGELKDDLDTVVDALLYAERPSYQSLESRLKEVSGLNSEALEAVDLGLSVQEVLGHAWFNKKIARKTLSLLKSQTNVEAMRAKMAEVRGKRMRMAENKTVIWYSEHQAHKGEYGEKNDRELSSFWDKQKKSKTLDASIAKIRNLSYYKLRRLGLSRDDIEWLHDRPSQDCESKGEKIFHAWSNPGVTSQTLLYLEA